MVIDPFSSIVKLWLSLSRSRHTLDFFFDKGVEDLLLVITIKFQLVVFDLPGCLSLTNRLSAFIKKRRDRRFSHLSLSRFLSLREVNGYILR